MKHKRPVPRGFVSAIVAANCFALVVAVTVTAQRDEPTTQQLVPAQDGFSFTWGSGRREGPANTHTSRPA